MVYLKRPDYIGRVDRHTVSTVARVNAACANLLDSLENTTSF